MNILNQELFYQPTNETSDLELFMNCVRLVQELKLEYNLTDNEVKNKAEILFDYYNEKVYQEYGVRIFENDPYLEVSNGTTFELLSANYWFVFN